MLEREREREEAQSTGMCSKNIAKSEQVSLVID